MAELEHIAPALDELVEDAERLRKAIDGVEHATLAERLQPHPSQVRAVALDELTRHVIGQIHAIATECHKAGSYLFGTKLRKIAREASDRKAEILIEVAEMVGAK